jgi:hypothetical protein
MTVLKTPFDKNNIVPTKPATREEKNQRKAAKAAKVAAKAAAKAAKNPT